MVGRGASPWWWHCMAETYDDAIHMLSSTAGLTLCEQPVDGLNVVPVTLRPDEFSGCWTCLSKADERKP